MKCDELKDYDIMDIEAMDDERLEKSESGIIQVTRVYIKSEADKVIAELEESHKKEVGQLLIEIAELKKEKEYVIEYTADVINGQEREIQHHKYKRCLANANVCAEKLYRRNTTIYGYEFYCKWINRWLKLSEKFKPNNSTAH